MMTLCSPILIFGIIRLAIVSYGLPIADENDEALSLENFRSLEKSADNETFVKDQEELTTAVKDFQKFADLNETGIDLFQIAAHEFGHSLGIRHTDEKGALMAPTYKGYIADFQLHPDDIEAVQALYGSRDLPLPPDEENLDIGPPPYTDFAPDLCEDATINTITRTKSGSTYVFKGEFYWKVHPDGISERYPRKISEDWEGLEGNLDASVTWSNGKTFFFKDKRYWRFTDKKMDKWYPKLISVGFEGVPDNLDAALVWGKNGKTYFFKGYSYWRYDMNTDPHVSRDYPRSIKAWSDLLVPGINASFQWENNSTYLFKGDQYYRYNDITNEVDNYPALSTAIEWFGCRPMDHNSTEKTYST